MPLGAYDYTGVVNGSEPPPMRLCYSYYAAGGIENNTFKFDAKVNQGNYRYLGMCLKKK